MRRVKQCHISQSKQMSVETQAINPSCFPHRSDVDETGQREMLLRELEEDRKLALKFRLERRGEAQRNAEKAKFKMGQFAAQEWVDLEGKRDRLQKMLEEEEVRYRRERERMCQGGAGKGSRIEEMRCRVAFLKAEREARTAKEVQEKLTQAFQSQCEPLRALISAQIQKELPSNWDEQIQMKQRLKSEEEAEKQMWAHLRDVDAQQKQMLEDAQIQMRAELSRKGVDELNRQIKEKRAKAANAVERVKAQELAVIEEEKRQIMEEKMREEAIKRERYERAKKELNGALEVREFYQDRRMKREEIVAQELLKKAIREVHIEQEDFGKKKREMRDAIRIYLEYLQKRGQLLNTKEAEVQQMIDELIEEQYARTMESRAREHKQRLELEQSVIAGRTQQMRDIKEMRAREKEEEVEELTQLQKDLKLAQKQDALQSSAASLKKEQYISDLMAQKEYLRGLREREREEEKREDELCQNEEKLFNNRLQRTLQNAQVVNPNPHRCLLMGRKNEPCLRLV